MQLNDKNKSGIKKHYLALDLNDDSRRYQIRIYEKDLCYQCADDLAILCFSNAGIVIKN